MDLHGFNWSNFRNLKVLGHWHYPTHGFTILQLSCNVLLEPCPWNLAAVRRRVDSITALGGHVTEVNDVAMGLEAIYYAKCNKRFPTYVLMQKVWNKTRQLLAVTGFTSYIPIWPNGYYSELQLFINGKLYPVFDLQVNSIYHTQCASIIYSYNMLLKHN